MNLFFRKYLLVGGSIAFLLFLYVWRFIYVYPYASSWDQVDFVYSLEDFDLLKMQPHFPGYPYFVLGGMGIHLFLPLGPESFSILNHVLMLTAIIPIYLIARIWLQPSNALIVMIGVQVLSYQTIMVSQPMSEGAALAILWWFLWSIIFAVKQNHPLIDFLPLFLFSILLGIRLSYIAFGLGIIYLFYTIWKRNEPTRIQRLFLNFIAAIIFQLFWVMALAVNVGGFRYLLPIAFGFSEGHFTEWGGTAQEGNILNRIFQLVIQNIFWTGFSSENVILGILFIILMVASYYFKGSRNENHGTYIFLLIVTFLYLLWALMAQNIEKPRHSLPVISIASFLLFVRLSVKKNGIVNILLLVNIVAQGLVGSQLLVKQQVESPAVYQVAEWLEKQSEDIVIYTWEETRVFDYLGVSYHHKRIFTYELFLQEIKQYSGESIYVTNHVVDGFKHQGINVDDIFIPVAKFNSEQMFDPIYSHIIVYKVNLSSIVRESPNYSR